MASTSTSHVQKSFKYDVFLSFRGEDTRNKFVSHLYKALDQQGIDTYKDNEKIRKGKTISHELIKAIEDSRFYIIVFSKNYASSSWCLEELVKIMECQKMAEHTAYPVFHDVEPTEVRKLYGPVGEAFKKHEKEESAGKWREALKEAASLAGWELNTTDNGHEANFIQKIIQEISLELRCIDSSVDENLVGMDTRVNEVISSLETGVDEVRMIGIKGMGGAGKTTLARSVFDKISFQFEGRCFVENIREESKPSLSGLKSLQKQVLSDVLNDQGITVSGVHEGKKMIQKKMHVRKVLIVLDDVDKIEQLEALVGDRNWFKPGSRIIITTRDEQVLVAHKGCLIQNVNLLSTEEAICLFSRYAFGKEVPVPGYEELSGQVVHFAAGLPLTIRVLGSFLCGKNVHDWKDAIERLKTIPLKETLDKLELSYMGLEEDYKEIFLDVACILKGWRKEDAVIALESCGFHARNGLRVLEQRSLISYDTYGLLDMHDHIEEMGKNIVRRVNLNKPERHSRLWIKEEIEEILANDSGTPPATQCIRRIDAYQLNFEMLMKGLANMKELRFLHLDGPYVDEDEEEDSNWSFDEDDLHLPNGLRYLRWDYYPFKSLPKTFQPNNLVGLQMINSDWIVKLWKDGEEKPFPKLRFLKFYSFSKLRSLDLSVAPNLETLILEKCRNLVEVHFRVTPNLKELRIHFCNRLEKLHMPAQSPKLTSLKLSYLEKLRTFNLGITPNLETVSIDMCTDMVELQIPGECPKLIDLNLNNSVKLRTLHLEITPNLETLRLNDCTDMVELRMPAECPKLVNLHLDNLKLTALHLGITLNLEKLSVKKCTYMVELQIPSECSKLVNLNLDNLKLTTLHLGITPNLETLSVRKCTDMVELQIPSECSKLVNLDLNNLKLKTLHLGITPSLETLSLNDCTDMVELHMPAECPKLVNLHLDNSKLTALHLGITPNLETLRLNDCTDMVELHIPGECSKLVNLDLDNLKLTTLHLGTTPNLETLSLNDCTDMVELHMPAECPKLTSLYLDDLQKLRTLHLGITPNLEKLRLNGCTDMVELRMPAECAQLVNLDLDSLKLTTLHLGITPNLKTLSLKNCTDIVELHMPAECPKLVNIHLDNLKLTTLRLGITPNLETLSVKKCTDMVELQIPGECSKLVNLDLNTVALKTLDLENIPNIKRLDLKSCYDLVEINAPIGCLDKLAHFDLSGCRRFESFVFNKSPVGSRFGLLSELNLIAESIGTCPLHSDNNVPKFRFKCFYREGSVSSLGNLEKLLSFGLCVCTNIERFSGCISSLRSLRKLKLEGCITEAPKDLDQLECLEELVFWSTRIKHLPNSICMLKHLKFLELKSCWLIEKLPEDLGELECLEELYLTECIYLRDIPESICEMKRLKYFHLPYCTLVEKLPEELGRLECLKELNIECTGISRLPLSIFRLEGLRIVGTRWAT